MQAQIVLVNEIMIFHSAKHSLIFFQQIQILKVSLVVLGRTNLVRLCNHSGGINKLKYWKTEWKRVETDCNIKNKNKHQSLGKIHWRPTNERFSGVPDPLEIHGYKGELQLATDAMPEFFDHCPLVRILKLMFELVAVFSKGGFSGIWMVD